MKFWARAFSSLEQDWHLRHSISSDYSLQRPLPIFVLSLSLSLLEGRDVGVRDCHRAAAEYIQLSEPNLLRLML